MKLFELREAIANKTRELRQILDAANGGDLSTEAKTKFDALEIQVRGLQDQLGRETRIAEMERQAAGTPVNGTPDFDREVRNFSLCRAIAATFDNTVDAGREREISQELARRSGIKSEGFLAPTAIFHRRARPEEQRVLLSGSSGAGLIPTDHRDDLTVDMLRARSIVNVLGATVLGGLSGNVSFPRATSAPTAAWIAENGALSAADFDVDPATLTPKHVGVLTEVSRNMVLQSSPDIEAFVRADFARNLAAALDSAALVGGGSNQPDGIITRLIDAGQIGTWATPTWAQGLELIEDVETDNAVGSRMGWALHPAAVKKLRSTVRVSSTDSQFIMAEPNSLYGYTAQSSGHAALLGSPSGGTAIFGAWENLLIGYWDQFSILSNPFESVAYTKGNVQIRGLLTADIQVRRLESFSGCADMATA
jgi:HK97 family phage major capsid protein